MHAVLRTDFLSSVHRVGFTQHELKQWWRRHLRSDCLLRPKLKQAAPPQWLLSSCACPVVRLVQGSAPSTVLPITDRARTQVLSQEGTNHHFSTQFSGTSGLTNTPEASSLPITACEAPPVASLSWMASPFMANSTSCSKIASQSTSAFTMNCEAGDAYIVPGSVQWAEGPARTFCFAAFAELESKRAQEPPEKSPSLPAYPTLVVPSARGDGREARRGGPLGLGCSPPLTIVAFVSLAASENSTPSDLRFSPKKPALQERRP